MSDFSEQIVARARDLVGIPFRPQGRDPQAGLDCVGVVLNVFAIAPHKMRRNYRLRGGHLREIQDGLQRHFCKVEAEELSKGDVLLCAVGSDQAHLAIWCGQTFVHGDARLRRVVETPGRPAWPIIGAFRGREPQRPAS